MTATDVLSNNVEQFSHLREILRGIWEDKSSNKSFQITFCILLWIESGAFISFGYRVLPFFFSFFKKQKYLIFDTLFAPLCNICSGIMDKKSICTSVFWCMLFAFIRWFEWFCLSWSQLSLAVCIICNSVLFLYDYFISYQAQCPIAAGADI